MKPEGQQGKRIKNPSKIILQPPLFSKKTIILFEVGPVKLFVFKFGFSSPQVAWDGIESPDFYLEDGSVNPEYRICVNENEDVKTVNLSAATEFEDLEVNPAIFDCM